MSHAATITSAAATSNISSPTTVACTECCVWRRPPSSRVVAQIATRPARPSCGILRQVREELEHHFAQEESGGCLDEAVLRCPGLSGKLSRIELEHPQLLQHVDRLIAQALDCDQSMENRLTLEREFDELCRQLDVHEAAENALLRKGFGANVNGDERSEGTLILDS